MRMSRRKDGAPRRVKFLVKLVKKRKESPVHSPSGRADPFTDHVRGKQVHPISYRREFGMDGNKLGVQRLDKRTEGTDGSRNAGLNRGVEMWIPPHRIDGRQLARDFMRLMRVLVEFGK